MKSNAPGAARSSTDVDWLDLESGHDLRKEIQSAIQDPDGSLANKYLYLGSHGAQAWVDVENSPNFDIKQHARQMLQLHLPSVIEAIKGLSTDSKEGLDIVSLGAGTGADDVTILTALGNTYQGGRALFAVDLSIDLLRCAVTSLHKHLAERPQQRKNTKVHAICADISKLKNIMPHINARSPNGRRLYHLLGLTLGNNHELAFLRSISLGMSTGDFLLLGLDFCHDNDELRRQSISSYQNTQHEIMRFLSSPLMTVLQVDDQNVGNGHITLYGDMKLSAEQEHDYITQGIWIVTKGVSQAEGGNLSDIQGSLSIARYYVDRSVTPSDFDPSLAYWMQHSKLCDFSNKYKSEEFHRFIKANEETLGLTLVNNDIRQWKYNSQYLVLLQKLDSEKRKQAETVEAMARRLWDELNLITLRFRESTTHRIADRAHQLQTLVGRDVNAFVTAHHDADLQRFPSQSDYAGIGADEGKAKSYLDKLDKALK